MAASPASLRASGAGIWSALFDWLAGIFGVTKRGLGVPFAIAIVLGSILSVVFMIRWGYWRGLLPAVGLLVLAGLAARTVVALRDELWRAACLALEDPRQRPNVTGGGKLMGATASAIGALALAVSAVRRGELAQANDLTQLVDRRLLRPEEARLLDAVRAMISLGLGDDKRAAQQAFTVLPTGSPPIDEALGRVAVADAWGSPERLRAINAAWEEEGVTFDREEPLGLLHRLVRLRLGQKIETLSAEEARALCDEARAIGDDLLAVELEARARSSTYR